MHWHEILKNKDNNSQLRSIIPQHFISVQQSRLRNCSIHWIEFMSKEFKLLGWWYCIVYCIDRWWELLLTIKISKTAHNKRWYNNMGSKSIFSLSLISFSTICCAMLYVNHQNRKLLDKTKRRIADSSNSYIYPPLPKEVIEILKKSKLCFLATVSDQEPHLSLMNFTYDEVIF